MCRKRQKQDRCDTSASPFICWKVGLKQQTQTYYKHCIPTRFHAGLVLMCMCSNTDISEQFNPKYKLFLPTSCKHIQNK